MSIDITAAIEKRLDEIRLLLALRGELTLLITDAEEAAWGRPAALTHEEWGRQAVETRTPTPPPPRLPLHATPHLTPHLTPITTTT